MDGETFREELEAAKATELDRLGSEKLLLALTDADVTEENVLDAAANSEYAAAETFRRWADDEEHEEARDAFARIVAQEEEHYVRVTEHLDDHEPPDSAGPMHAYLREREDAIERVATGMVARAIVSVRAHNQVINFFVNEPDAKKADLFRDLKDETAGVIDGGLTLLDTLCTDEDDWERARATGEYAIQVAYDDYADSLQGMGLDPKPLC